MRRFISALAGSLLLAGALLAVPQAPKKEAGTHCKLTDKKVKKCCCVQREGKLYCKLAKKTIENCCCDPAQFPKEKR